MISKSGASSADQLESHNDDEQDIYEHQLPLQPPLVLTTPYNHNRNRKCYSN